MATEGRQFTAGDGIDDLYLMQAGTVQSCAVRGDSGPNNTCFVALVLADQAPGACFPETHDPILPPDRSQRPSDDNSTHRMALVRSSFVVSLPTVRSQTRTVASSPAEAQRRPSG